LLGANKLPQQFLDTRNFSTKMSKKNLHISGWTGCGAFQQAKQALLGMKAIYPQEFAVDVQECKSTSPYLPKLETHCFLLNHLFSLLVPTRDEYMTWLPTFRDTVGASNHKTSPIVWFEGGKYLGGRDDTLAWLKKQLSVSDESAKPEAGVNVDPWNPNHGFDYDLVVIGGGSGGLACAKEAAKLGVKVASLDYVKPSPHGTKWGLGGTCVNVGCIPKKLMHFGAHLHEYHEMSKNYGWNSKDLGTVTNDWPTLRDAIQDHIKGLNFGYRVQLREAGITYLNKLGKFVGPNQLETTDAKGNKQVISGARFVIATGGRPSALDIPGGEHAITSDDLFSLEKSPGKTCVVGAGYVALECGGFVSGLKQGEVVVLVRSVPLRSFDQETVKYVIDYMTSVDGVRIVQGVLPKKIEKLSNGKLKVFYGDKNESEEFDTVLCAIGRSPDLKLLGIDALPGLQVHERTHKIIHQNEQTSIPHIYALGDIIHGAPELTPSAILAGRLLAKRLFGNGTELMDYKNIATAVFTPLELGTVGLTEEEAQEKYGKENIDCFISAFKPLEWSITDRQHDVNAFCKVVFNKAQNNKIVGMHIASPQAGELIQGYALALSKGLTTDVRRFH
jgi:thioredoxin/glutathione reductase (selenoprotein)